MMSGISRHATLRMMAATSSALCSRLSLATAPRSLMLVSNAGFGEAVRSFNQLMVREWSDLSNVFRYRMQVAIAACLRQLPRHVMAEQSRQAARQRDELCQIDRGGDAHLVAQIHEIFRADVAGCARRERAAAQAAQRRVEAAR